MPDTVPHLTQRLDDIHTRYRRSFANRSRATRDLGQLDGLIRELGELSGAVAPVAGAPVALGARISELQDLFTRERGAIAAVLSRGPDAIAVARLADWSDVDFHRYMRLFGGQNRTTRDLELLRELLADETARRAALLALPGAVDQDDGAQLKTRLDSNIALYEKEVAAIPVARRSLDAREYSRVLATLANGQFALYRLHFAEKPRRGRRIALLERIIRSLDAVSRAMVAVKELGVDNESHRSNITKVAERIAHHKSELEQVRAAKAGSSSGALAGTLGDEANAVFQTYRSEFSGQPRATRNADRLSEHAERLHEIARGMNELQAAMPEAGNANNLGIVLDALKVYEREYRAVKDARTAQA